VHFSDFRVDNLIQAINIADIEPDLFDRSVSLRYVQRFRAPFDINHLILILKLLLRILGILFRVF